MDGESCLMEITGNEHFGSNALGKDVFHFERCVVACFPVHFREAYAADVPGE